MNQDKIGSFIASCRKEQGLTQANLAEKLGITDRAMKAVFLAPHWGRNRYMKCPHCGKRGYHKKVLTK